MEEYKSNSDKSKQLSEDHALRPVTKGKVTVKKEPISRKFTDTFLSDQVSNVKEYLYYEVIVPAIKDTFVDSVSNGINMLVYGSSAGRRKTGRHNSGERTSYSSYYRGSDSKEDRPRNASSRRQGLQDIIFETRGDAQEVMVCMDEVMDKYHIVSIADYYDLAGASECATYTDNNFGWFDLEGMTVVRDRDGYRIRLPKPESLK